MTRPHYTLGLETSCDETSAAVVAEGRHVLANIISSQIPLHRRFGGVVPEIASRKHVELVVPVVREAVAEAGLQLADIDSIAVTAGPGLIGALLVGVATAKALAWALDRPLVGVNHLAGHIAANYLEQEEPLFPALCLVVSGGHTDLLLMTAPDQATVLGRTLDDAAGEAFDKVARAIGLPYPGGPAIEEAAASGDATAVDLPQARLGEGSFDTSFSGLKTAVLNYLNHERQAGREIDVPDVAASFQRAVVSALVSRVESGIARYQPREVMLAGGVAANGELRAALRAVAERAGIRFRFPPPRLCTDNAAMIAAAGYRLWRAGRVAALNLNATANLPLGYANALPSLDK
ncbi:MAG: tRNA (adenosine(37)-N6)-threonylcarbamoyltransferase complex transferase subunit TsaD [Chloroflexota bacterium]